MTGAGRLAPLGLMNWNVLTPGTEKALVRAAAAGSEQALAELYGRYAEMVYRVAYRLVPEAADAEDVLQDVFIALPEALGRFDDNRPLEPWLKRVAARAAISRARSSQRRESRANAAAEGQRLYGRETPGPLEKLIIKHALDQLPLSLRTVLVLKEVEGYTHEEIAQMLGISSASAATRLHRAWAKLRQQVG